MSVDRTALVTLNELAITAASTLDLNELLDQSLAALTRGQRFDRALILLIDRGTEALHINRHDLFACSVMGIVQIGCGLVAFTFGSRHLPAADLVLLAQTEVVLSPVWAWLVVGEVPAFWTLVGGTMVLAAVTFQALAGTRRGAVRKPRNR